uniref:Uncharacterized protein n=1 Tax=Terrapene triunguis TaxID=2587831 RepID=A0A674JS65_9SAUR
MGRGGCPERGWAGAPCVLGLVCIHVSLRWPRRQVALQFPDELLADSAAVAAKMEATTGSKMYILGDTSYGRSVPHPHLCSGWPPAPALPPCWIGGK